MPPQANMEAIHDMSASPIDTIEDADKMYGPYPSAVPIPFVSKDESTPPKEEMTDANSYLDLQKYPDHRDVGTPDEWLPRDGRLVRLTGRHPFNVEPPMSELRKTRFITPSSLHYVRNHGACPRLTWEEHSIVIGGPGVTKPMELSMDELVDLALPRELPVTLVCAGNRRKEQNQIRQTIGFNWGPCGVSTNVYKGCRLRDVLLAAGVSERNMKGMHVEFIGVEDLPNKVGPGPFKDEPWGKKVKYGTSIPLARAMNPAYDVLLAYGANGEKLQPDHGYPVRLIIPGYIGGRMIKWLKHINVIRHETKNHYHYHDNRILPPHVTAEQSLVEEWWYRPEYIFNELNINSAIASPLHNEELSIAKNIDKTYNVSGYAYTGGGRKITRVEVSTDGGIHWNLATLDRKEEPTDYDMHWCWVWWDYELRVVDLVGCKEVLCRAWDESNMTQPDNPTWNLMGMGNNQVFRLKIHMEKSAVTDDHVFRFEQPTQPGQQKGGWMTRLADKPESAGFGKLLAMEVAKETVAAPVVKKNGKVYTAEEVRKHNLEHDIWIIINDRIYDCTKYLADHPGGMDSITINGGEDASEDFVAIHSAKATAMLEKFYVGDLKPRAAHEEEKKEDDTLVDAQGRKLALNPRKKTPFKLQNKEVLSRDSFMLDFALPTPDHVLGLPTGKHMFLSAKINGETILRRYTPISSNYDVGCVKFVIKAYPPAPPRFPIGGKMSQYLDALKIGDFLDFRGPVGELEYEADGKFQVDNIPYKATCFNMIAGGTGITPVMQIASEVLRHPADPTKISLIFACREEGDLLMRSTLDEWATQFSHKFKVHYILSDSVPEGWTHSKGFVDKKLFEDHLHPQGDDVWNLMCGPPIMLDRGCTPNLVAIGHQKERIFSF
mmetsp:Transcript_69563/g.77827  ORF Transcript_69563/g.77827 Transcript_69563/m.77827 type:complete len:888 (+) Transcript_69563:61-2724(+)